MNKKEFAEMVKTENRSNGINLTLIDTQEVVDCVFKTIQDVLQTEGAFTIPKFGTFSIQISKARKGRNPHTGKTIDVPEKNRVKFKTSSTFKKCIN